MRHLEQCRPVLQHSPLYPISSSRMSDYSMQKLHHLPLYPKSLSRTLDCSMRQLHHLPQYPKLLSMKLDCSMRQLLVRFRLAPHRAALSWLYRNIHCIRHKMPGIAVPAPLLHTPRNHRNSVLMLTAHPPFVAKSTVPSSHCELHNFRTSRRSANRRIRCTCCTMLGK